MAEVARAALAGLKRQAGNEVLRGVAVAAVACDLVLRLHALHLVGGSAVAVVVVLGLGGSRWWSGFTSVMPREKMAHVGLAASGVVSISSALM